MKVSCLDISRDGSLLAMGMTTTIGVPADIYVWDIQQCKLQQTFSLHKVLLAFPANYTISHHTRALAGSTQMAMQLGNASLSAFHMHELTSLARCR
jgi:hypothetical protein